MHVTLRFSTNNAPGLLNRQLKKRVAVAAAAAAVAAAAAAAALVVARTAQTA